MSKEFLVTSYDEVKRLIQIRIDSLDEFFYLTRNLNKTYSHYHNKKRDMYISFINNEKIKEVEDIKAKSITAITSISEFDGETLNVLYSNKLVMDDIKDLISKMEYKMFVDFEFSMPEFGSRAKFIPEIIQIGSVITDNKDSIVNEYNEYVKPIKKISDRTISFLNLPIEELDEATKPKDFYKHLKRLYEIFKPIAITWGSSDSKSLQTFYKLNKFEPIPFEFVDLSKLIKKYFSLTNDISLFNALKVFKEIDATQAHHALTDACATKEVFEVFKYIVINDIDFNIKEKIENIKR